MSAIQVQGRFHFVYIAKFIRYGLVLCLVPMLQALIRFDLQSLYTALRQDAVILVVMAVISVWLWRQAGFSLTQEALTLKLGFLSRARSSSLQSGGCFGTKPPPVAALAGGQLGHRLCRPQRPF